MRKVLKPVPSYSSQAAERKFWETHDSTDIDWSKANRRDVPYQSLIKVWLQEKIAP